MSKILTGTAHVFARDDIDTDLIIPAKYLNTSKAEELAPHTLEPLGNAELLRGCNSVVAAGKNFGCGSSREHAVWALAGAGVTCVIAESFARIFFRNSVNFGLPTVVLPHATKLIRAGDKLEINYARHTIKNLTQKKEYGFEPLPEFLQAIVNAGGLLNQIT